MFNSPLLLRLVSTIHVTDYYSVGFYSNMYDLALYNDTRTMIMLVY